MRLNLRGKLLLIVGATALAFLLVILVGGLSGVRETRHLDLVEGRLLPKIELGSQIEADFERLKRGLHDAAAAQDPETLSETRTLMGVLNRRLQSARDVLEPGKAEAALAALDAYDVAAYDVARRMVAGETGEALVDAVSAMQAKQSRADEALKQAIRLDRGELTRSFEGIRRARWTATQLGIAIGVASFLIVLGLAFAVSQNLLRVLSRMSTGFARFGAGDFSTPIALDDRTDDQLGPLIREANQMAASLLRLGQERDHIDWLKSGQAGLGHALRGAPSPEEVAARGVGFLVAYLGAPAGALYANGGDPRAALQLLGQSGLSGPSAGNDGDTAPASFQPGEGLVGQAALQEDLVEIDALPPGYLRVRSALGEHPPRALVLVPLFHLGRLRGVLELAFFRAVTPAARELLTATRETLVIALEVAQARKAMQALLEETQRQAGRLSAQEQELRASNEELQTQQEELRQINDELEAQRTTLEDQNKRLEEAQRRLEQKAGELVTVSAYKSRFLANMSHELRTPLNSMLILSELLAQNEAHNLSDKQVEYCKTINSAGRDLLSLINQVLDLSRIEAGKQQIHVAPVALAEVTQHLARMYEPLAADKQLTFTVELIEQPTPLPRTIVTDRQRLEQVLTNLLGNAIKFTSAGHVTLRVAVAPPEVRLRRRDLAQALAGQQTLAFSVTDTGAGIAPKDQELVFAPFERLDRMTDARYGSTGLGLSIARELCALLGGEMHLESTPGKGSTFTCYLPCELALAPEPTAEASATEAEASPPAARTSPTPVRLPDDREALGPGDTCLLLVEDDPVFAERLVDVIRGRGFKVLVAPLGEEAIALAKRHKPSGIILDVHLPDLTGWTVMDRLRRDPETEALPVHFVSAVDAPERGWAMGAVGYLTKPASNRELVGMVQSLAPRAARKLQQILVLEADDTDDSLTQLLEADGLRARRVGSSGAAFEALAAERYVCLILDLGLRDMDGLGFLEQLSARGDLARPPVVVYTGRALTRDETRRIEAYAEAVVLKEGRSSQRLLEEVRLFIHHVEDRLPRARKPRKPPTLGPPADERVFRGKRLLVVDDDMRTVYALSALLRTKGADVVMADTGRAALDALTREAPVGIDAVIMDVMMPEMDGYEAMRRIRAIDRFDELPIIALTAKAMKGERERCLEAGASGYLSKPIDSGELLALLATWLQPAADGGRGDAGATTVGGPRGD